MSGYVVINYKLYTIIKENEYFFTAVYLEDIIPVITFAYTYHESLKIIMSYLMNSITLYN